MTGAALIVVITAGLVLVELARRGRCSVRGPQALLVLAAVLCTVHVIEAVPARILYAAGFYLGCVVIIAMLAVVALWPVLGDVFDFDRSGERSVPASGIREGDLRRIVQQSLIRPGLIDRTGDLDEEPPLT